MHFSVYAGEEEEYFMVARQKEKLNSVKYSTESSKF